MYISVMFKDKNKVFKGKSYDFKLATSETPKVGSIIRMYNADFTKVVCNATRVKVMAVKETSDAAANEPISYIETTLDD